MTMPGPPPNAVSSTVRCGSSRVIADVVHADVQQAGLDRLAQQALPERALEQTRGTASGGRCARSGGYQRDRERLRTAPAPSGPGPRDDDPPGGQVDRTTTSFSAGIRASPSSPLATHTSLACVRTISRDACRATAPTRCDLARPGSRAARTRPRAAPATSRRARTGRSPASASAAGAVGHPLEAHQRAGPDGDGSRRTVSGRSRRSPTKSSRTGVEPLGDVGQGAGPRPRHGPRGRG